ncbi:beta-ketoacyl-ACP synthase III [Xanthobacter dioxanivorans]|uniref:3-oxopimeloyl-[acyl-carrier-protein] synthase n=1 Tax=Xanthobacter dioxanivorans TaxID=2528964 RepID=A0A974PRG6_9HYPH|nr:beta-ketoacyl-ACP synthase III [Xanthobacter dioxanivorans]QRG08383.1 beta-ketoacyl-ACP synthase III [Xanthobacter dioxanivorans]
MSRAGTRIAGHGHHAPDRVVANAEIEGRLGLAAGWIESRTGIRARRYAAAGEAVSDIALPAAEMALEMAHAACGLPRAMIGLTLLATSTPDHLLPPTAPLLAYRLGLPASGAADLTGACAGFLYAYVLAEGFVRASGQAALVVAANILSRRIDPQDASTSALFADAAGAVVIAPADRAGTGLLASRLASDGSGYDLIQIPDSGSRRTGGEERAGVPRMVMRDGRAVFQRAVAMMGDACRHVLDQAGLTPDEVTHFVPHQANGRIVSAVADRLGIAPARTLSTLAEFGNSSAATLPFTLSACAGARGYGEGDVLLMAAAGAGLTGGAALVRL